MMSNSIKLIFFVDLCLVDFLAAERRKEGGSTCSGG
ncbi:hypothetical protein GLYMA_18G115651v4 [Glycine max]|nr:hypothetical protein GLYMA_18G115651v4 [Glycine max]KAH1154151.1 hypothetical protein GYH30_049688 [Glycine max]